MQARCVCTMDQVSEHEWRKPEEGYKNPDPNCSFCRGKGFQEITLGGPDAKALWIGYCSVCGAECAGRFTFEDDEVPPFPGDKYTICPNRCSDMQIQWEKTDPTFLELD